MANTINSGLTPDEDRRGRAMPAAVRPATVADPTHTRITVAINQAKIKGEMVEPLSKLPIYSLTPLSIKTSFRPPAPAIINNTIVIPATAWETESIISFIARPRFNPNV